MKKNLAATLLAVAALSLGLGVGLPFANANETGGGQCNNYGNNSIVVAPFCGATLGGAPTTSLPRTVPSGPGSTTTTTINRGPYIPVG